jgi:hypothetical protein
VKVNVTPSAIDYEPKKPEPKRLEDTAVPTWVQQRADKLRVALHRRLQTLSAGRGGAAVDAGTHD